MIQLRTLLGATLLVLLTCAAPAGAVCRDGLEEETRYDPADRTIRSLVRLCEGKRDGPVLVRALNEDAGGGRRRGSIVATSARGGDVIAVGLMGRPGGRWRADVRLFSATTRRLLHRSLEEVKDHAVIRTVVTERGDAAWSGGRSVRLRTQDGALRTLAQTGGAWLALLEDRTLRWGFPQGGIPFAFHDLTPPPVQDGCPLRTRPEVVLDTPELRVTQDEMGDGGDFALRVCTKAAGTDALVGSGQAGGRLGPGRSRMVAAWPAGVAWVRDGVLRVARGGGLISVLDRGTAFARLRVVRDTLRWTRDGRPQQAPLG